jgi:hypothetical protein
VMLSRSFVGKNANPDEILNKSREREGREDRRLD